MHFWGGTHSWYHLERARIAFSQGEQIQHDVNLPKSVAVIHCKEHQKSVTVQETGNMMVDQVAIQAAEGKEISELALILDSKLKISEPESEPLRYSRDDRNLINNLKEKKAS